MMNAENFFVAGGANSNRVISQVSASISFSETCQFGIQTLNHAFPEGDLQFQRLHLCRIGLHRCALIQKDGIASRIGLCLWLKL